MSNFGQKIKNIGQAQSNHRTSTFKQRLCKTKFTSFRSRMSKQRSSRVKTQVEQVIHCPNLAEKAKTEVEQSRNVVRAQSKHRLKKSKHRSDAVN